MVQTIEVFSAGCPLCHGVVEMVTRLAGSSQPVAVLDMHRGEVATRALQLGIQRVPSVVIDGRLAECCVSRGCDEATLRRAIQGS
jgi:hypothetical protein